MYDNLVHIYTRRIYIYIYMDMNDVRARVNVLLTDALIFSKK